jgi:hypothetical protein
LLWIIAGTDLVNIKMPQQLRWERPLIPEVKGFQEEQKRLNEELEARQKAAREKYYRNNTSCSTKAFSIRNKSNQSHHLDRRTDTHNGADNYEGSHAIDAVNHDALSEHGSINDWSSHESEDTDARECECKRVGVRGRRQRVASSINVDTSISPTKKQDVGTKLRSPFRKLGKVVQNGLRGTQYKKATLAVCRIHPISIQNSLFLTIVLE